MLLTSDQEEILSLLKELWQRHPQQRLGQLLENYVFYQGQRGDRTSVALFYQYDTDTIDLLRSKQGEKMWENRAKP